MAEKRYTSRQEIEDDLSKWQEKRAASLQLAGWLEHATKDMDRIIRDPSTPGRMAALLKGELVEVCKRIETLKRVGSRRLEQLSQKLAEFNTVPMSGIIDGTVKKRGGV